MVGTKASHFQTYEVMGDDLFGYRQTFQVRRINFIDRLVTCDETWVDFYRPEKKTKKKTAKQCEETSILTVAH